jgi:hypothetical protein
MVVGSPKTAGKETTTVTKPGEEARREFNNALISQ